MCSTSCRNRGFLEKHLCSQWLALKSLFNVAIPGALLGEGRLLLAYCGNKREVNFILEDAIKIQIRGIKAFAVLMRSIIPLFNCFVSYRSN